MAQGRSGVPVVATGETVVNGELSKQRGSTEGFESRLFEVKPGTRKYRHCSYRREVYEVDAKREANPDRIMGAGTYGHAYTARLRRPSGGGGGLSQEVVIKQSRIRDPEHKMTQEDLEVRFMHYRLAYRELHVLRHMTSDDFSQGEVKFCCGNVVEMRSISSMADETFEWTPCMIMSVDESKEVVDLQKCNDKSQLGYKRDVPFNLIRYARSPYIVTLIDAFSPIASDLCLTLDRMDCDLKQLLEHNSTFFTTNEIRYIMYQVMAGMKFVHSSNVFHRDMKPANVLIKGSQYQVKITDFGMARVIDEIDAFEDARSENVGTIYYNAPEVFLSHSLRKPYTSAVDNWSIGCIFAELLRVERSNYDYAPICTECGKETLRRSKEIKEIITNNYKFDKDEDWIIDQWHVIKFKDFSRFSEEFAVGSILPEEVAIIDNVIERKNIAKARFKVGEHGINVGPVFCINCVPKDPKDPEKPKYGFTNCYRYSFLKGDVSKTELSCTEENRFSQLMVNLSVSGLPSYNSIKELYKEDSNIKNVLKPLYENSAASAIQRLFRGKNKKIATINKLDLRKTFPHVYMSSPSALDLLQKLFDFDPRSRISAVDALEHPFLSICSERNKHTEYTYGGKDLKDAVLNKNKSIVESYFSGTNLPASISLLHESIKEEHNIFNRKFGPEYVRSLSTTTSTCSSSSSSSSSSNDNGTSSVVSSGSSASVFTAANIGEGLKFQKSNK